MAVVHIPFLPRFREPLIKDKKLMTCRTTQKAKPGDTFEAFGSPFIVEDVYRIRLGYVAELNWELEGCASRDDFVSVWQFLHPSGFDPERMVWLHLFRRRGSLASYPDDWAEISHRVREAAGWKCERCGVANDPSVGRLLTVNHMDMDPTNCDPENLAALCQRCHLYVQGRGFPRSDWIGKRQLRLEDGGPWRKGDTRP